MPTTPQNATDATTIGESLTHLEQNGFTGQFAPAESGRVHCHGCGEDSDAADVRLHALLRTEGASDPDDMTAVAALECPRCGAKGTAVLHYGPEAGADDAAVLLALEDRREGTGITPS